VANPLLVNCGGKLQPVPKNDLLLIATICT